MINKILTNIKNIFESGIFKNIVVMIASLSLFLIGLSIYWQINSSNPDPITVMVLLISAVMAFLFIAVFIVSNRVSNIFTFVKRGKKRVSKLRKRIIVAFSIGAALPAIIVAIFRSISLTLVYKHGLILKSQECLINQLLLVNPMFPSISFS